MRITVQRDDAKAEALRLAAGRLHERLSATRKEAYPSETLVDYYEILHRLMEAIAIENGIKFKGEGTHKELITYIARRFVLDEGFLQRLREYRNRISYEGFTVTHDYLRRNERRIREIIEELGRGILNI